MSGPRYTTFLAVLVALGDDFIGEIEWLYVKYISGKRTRVAFRKSNKLAPRN